MPNCCLFECPADSRRCRGLTFHSVKRVNLNWEAVLLKTANRADKGFNKDNARICSRHFERDCFTDPDRPSYRKLKAGSIPTKFLVLRSHTRVNKPRNPPKDRSVSEEFEKQSCPEEISRRSYQEIKSEASDLRFPGYTVIGSGDHFDIIKYGDLQVTKCLRVSHVPENDGVKLEAWVNHKKAPFCPNGKDINAVLGYLEKLNPCCGISDERLISISSSETGSYYRNTCYSPRQNKTRSTIFSKSCLGTSSSTTCKNCLKVKYSLNRNLKRRSITEIEPLKKNTPLSTVSRNKLKMALKLQRQKNKKLLHMIEKMQKELDKEGVDLDDSMHNSLKTILHEQKVEDKFLKLFWNEQLKNFGRKPTSRRWHPTVIQTALLLHSQSPAAYETLRTTGVLTLPGKTTLRDYTNYVTPSQGFQPEVIEELADKVKKLKDNEKHVAILHDEMSIKQDLVYNSASGELVGFINNRPGTLATHVLTFMVVGLNPSSNLKFVAGYFGTTNATADDLFPLFWKCVSLMELKCGLQVIISTSDKASPNQRLVDMHGGSNSVINIFAPHRRIYFISDPPHLVKTVRNNLANSGAGTGSRYLWNNGYHLLWNHFKEVYRVDTQRELRRTKLRADHLYLTSYNKMKVNLAAQLLSSSVANVMVQPEAAETRRFVVLMDKFFDCVNARSTVEAKKKVKPELEAYTDLQDPRFEFIQKEFLGYLRTWYDNVQARNGFTKTEKASMFLSYQTYKGLVTTANSVVEAIQFLLNNGVPRVYPNLFCQDPLEAHFGRLRMAGRMNDNPNLNAVGYSENRMRIQREASLVLRKRGNITLDKTKPVIPVTNSPLKRKQRKGRQTHT